MNVETQREAIDTPSLLYYCMLHFSSVSVNIVSHLKPKLTYHFITFGMRSVLVLVSLLLDFVLLSQLPHKFAILFTFMRILLLF